MLMFSARPARLETPQVAIDLRKEMVKKERTNIETC